MGALNPTTSPITYDAHGRMNFNPEYHSRQGMARTTGDEKYLIEHYNTSGPEQVSLALERTIHTIMTKAWALRKAGRMVKPATRKNTKRSRTPATA